MTKVGEELLALADDDGVIFPDQVVDWARGHPKSALHAQFQWDVARAAREHWLWQARQLIAVHVVDDAGHRQTISLSIDRGHGGGYRPLDQVLANDELRRLAVGQAIGEALRWRERNSHLLELRPVFRSIERLEGKFREAAAAAEAAAAEATAAAKKPRGRPRRRPEDRPSA